MAIIEDRFQPYAEAQQNTNRALTGFKHLYTSINSLNGDLMGGFICSGHQIGGFIFA